ncbi:hypothetical protein ASPFODRAFT_207717 [Aspergillus luchuensis CBS 106.47]|uniref:FAD-binding PCMH-type domain-containing protein n=1 Tax=Aspergillus luchuensis (strain CBS 106.47) TaxID=1137211 RepID=A0A1M3TGH7_ASPLC|nr:hypothetical protein ASPFODRAFT_207717 [Aspergillus luchuensis CBS 106.47]
MFLSLFVAAAFLAIPSAGRAPSNCCASLVTSLGSKISYPSSTSYNKSIQSYWSQQEQSISPACVLSATSSQDVSTALKLLTSGDCKFAVRSGGHAAIAGHANIQDGVTIDLTALNHIVPSADHLSVSIGPGNTWGRVYTALDGLNVSVPGGRDSPVGVGGLTLGGGFGYFATLAGFACDNILQYEVVLASGEIVQATSQKNHDLWLALKGGSSNFGIVTNFNFQTFPLGGVWGGDAYFAISTVNQQLSALYNFTANRNYDRQAGLMVNLAYTPSTGPILTNTYAYAAPVAYPTAFEEFTAIPQLSNTTQISSLATLAIAEGSASPNGYQQITFAVTVKNSLPMLKSLFELWNASSNAVAGIAGIEWTITLAPIVPAITGQSARKGGNVLGLDDLPSEGLILAILSATFDSVTDYDFVDDAAQRLADNIVTAAKHAGAYNDYVDVNHAAAWQDPIASYSSDNIAFLKRTAEQYDPEAVFQNLMPGGFKL